MKNNRIQGKNNVAGEKVKGLMSLAGCWKMSDKEAKEFLAFTRKGWKNWKIPSV